MFRCVAVAGIIGFGLYTGMKAAYLSTVFATRVEERNLIYIAPLLFIGTALVLERRRVNLVALGGQRRRTASTSSSARRSRWACSSTRTRSGFAILQQANRYYEWTPATAQWLLIGILVVGVALARGCDDRSARSGAVVTGVAAALAVGILAWNVTGEICGRGRHRLDQPRARGDAAASVHLGRRRRAGQADALSRAGRRRPATPSGSSSSGTARS